MFWASNNRVVLLFFLSAALWGGVQCEKQHQGGGGGDKCEGKRVYMYEIPAEFNRELLEKCRFGITRWLNFCSHVANEGLGQALEEENVEERLGKGWFTTDAYMLEVIFHSRMRRYPCLTTDPAMADAFFLPYYTGVDALHYLYSSSSSSSAAHKIPHGLKLVSWLEASAKSQWQKYGGLDHFLIMGRTSWDFGRHESEHYRWGTGILELPHFANMTTLLIEKQPWMANQQAVPYPTSFHPSPRQLQAWMHKVRTAERPFLFAFAGSIRPDLMKGGIRDSLLQQCTDSYQCALVDCKKFKCSHNPEPIVTAFLRSIFCLQPRGDTPTRRSIFDSIISGCIPVLFHNDSAYTQYTWHLPEDVRSWSVYISEDDIRQGVRVEEVLRSYTRERIWKMREKVMEVMPRLIYGGGDDANGMQEAEPDAFDTSVERVLGRVADLKQQKQKQME